MEVTGRCGRRRRKQLPDDFKTKWYWKLKEEALALSVWITRFERGNGPIAGSDYGINKAIMYKCKCGSHNTNPWAAVWKQKRSVVSTKWKEYSRQAHFQCFPLRSIGGLKMMVCRRWKGLKDGVKILFNRIGATEKTLSMWSSIHQLLRYGAKIIKVWNRESIESTVNLLLHGEEVLQCVLRKAEWLFSDQATHEFTRFSGFNDLTDWSVLTPFEPKDCSLCYLTYRLLIMAVGHLKGLRSRGWIFCLSSIRWANFWLLWVSQCHNIH